MDAEEKFGHWLDTAEYDIGTADAMAASRSACHVPAGD